MYFDQPVKINEITAEGVREIKFDPDTVRLRQPQDRPEQMRGLGFAGFRVHSAINARKYKDEVLVFLGASYFRALGKGQVYGLSRAAWRSTPALSSGEEFPRFVEFWLERPGRPRKELTIYALLDSRACDRCVPLRAEAGRGDQRSTSRRGSTCAKPSTKLGLAPLTSMFFFGENQRPTVDDYRPEVHDSDGLSVHSATGEWIWRPLVNPKRCWSPRSR